MRGRAVTRLAASGSLLLCGVALAAAGCGGGAAAQDANEPEAEFDVDVVDASFPEDQKLAKDSVLEIEVENVDSRTIPNINVTVDGFDYKLRDPDEPDEIDPNVADPRRPIFVVEKSPVEYLRDRFPANASLVDREVNPPAGGRKPWGEGDTAYVNTFSLGELPAGEKALFRWAVSAVKPGPFELRYEVTAGFDGKATAVGPDGEVPTGRFRGVVSSDSPRARVAEDDGETVITEDGRKIEDQRDVLTDP